MFKEILYELQCDLEILRKNVDEMRKSVYNADWKIVAEQHFSKIYKPLLNINK